MSNIVISQSQQRRRERDFKESSQRERAEAAERAAREAAITPAERAMEARVKEAQRITRQREAAARAAEEAERSTDAELRQRAAVAGLTHPRLVDKFVAEVRAAETEAKVEARRSKFVRP